MGEKTTPPFHVASPWQLQWHSDGGLFFVDIRTENGILVDSAGGGMNNLSGDTYVPHGGDFVLHINAGTSWSIEIVTLPQANNDIQPSNGNGPQSDPTDIIESDGSIFVPPCDGTGVSGWLKQVIEQSPLAQTLHLKVLDTDKISSRKTKSGRMLCSTSVLENTGLVKFEFQIFARHGQLFLYAIPASGEP
jgi:hypothetical protein